jgi:phospholipid N-methyltransferase
MSFFKSFLRNPQAVGAFFPTGASYSHLACKQVDWDTVSNIAELGAGDGAVTQYIVQYLKPHQKLFVFETDEHLLASLKNKINQENVIIIHDSAEHLPKYLGQHGVQSVDAIFSEVPLVSLPKQVGDNILQAVKSTLKSGGKFLQISYSLFGKKKIQSLFDTVSIQFTFFNLPPAFLYICQLANR